MPTANVTFAIKAWDEETQQEFDDGRKLTQCHIAYTYEGDIEGECTLEYLMYYSGEGQPTTFTGLERISGALNGKQGSFVLRHTGVDDGGGTRSDYVVVANSGTGELKGLTGKGSFTLDGHQEKYAMSLEYELP